MVLAAQPSHFTRIAHDSAHHAVAEGKIEFGKLAQEMLRSFTRWARVMQGSMCGWTLKMHVTSVTEVQASSSSLEHGLWMA